MVATVVANNEVIQCDQPPPHADRHMDKPLASLAYAHCAASEAVKPALRRFLDGGMGIQDGMSWAARSLQAGGGGDCFFHSVALILEQMLFHSEDVHAASHVLQHPRWRVLQPADFRKGKMHLVKLLRQMVAAQIVNFSLEEFVGFVFTLRNAFDVQQSGAVGRDRIWHDQWNPHSVLRSAGLEMLSEANTVIAIGASEENAADLMIRYETSRSGEEVVCTVDNGVFKLNELKRLVASILTTCGNTHWATQTDVVALGEALNIGFVIFSSEANAAGQWLYGFNPKRGNFPYWVSLYCDRNVHFTALQLQRGNEAVKSSFWSRQRLPPAVRNLYTASNPDCPVGAAFGLGIC